MTHFFIADTHFSHQGILRFEPELRPFASVEEHDEELVRRWNATVSPTDIVYHLGDVFFPLSGAEYIKRLKGRKKLVMGNHDARDISLYVGLGFEVLPGIAEYKDFFDGRTALLTHAPIHPDSLFGKRTLNVHGHIHSKLINDARYMNVSVEHTNLQPIALEELRANLITTLWERDL